jgi:hypothetical protein
MPAATWSMKVRAPLRRPSLERRRGAGGGSGGESAPSGAPSLGAREPMTSGKLATR